MEIRNAFFAAMKTSFSKLLLTLTLLPTLSFALPLEYSASYNIEKYGMVIAESNYSLRHENNGVRMRQHTETVGLAALLRNDVLDENSLLSLQDDKLLLTEFSYIQKSSDEKNRDIHIKIDWIQSEKKLFGNVKGTAKGEALSLKLNKAVWDTSSYQIPLMNNTKEGGEPQKISMMVKGSVKEYNFITHNTEEIEVNGNTINTIKIERDGSKNKSPIYLWLAPGLNNLPVKIEKWKNGKLQLTLTLQHAQFLSDKSKVFNAGAEEIDEFDDL